VGERAGIPGQDHSHINPLCGPRPEVATEPARQPRDSGARRAPFPAARRPGHPGGRRTADHRHRVPDWSFMRPDVGWYNDTRTQMKIAVVVLTIR